MYVGGEDSALDVALDVLLGRATPAWFLWHRWARPPRPPRPPPSVRPGVAPEKPPRPPAARLARLRPGVAGGKKYPTQSGQCPP
eukprot:scaffold49381_cov213-Isochrysis_galbana.AAC.1